MAQRLKYREENISLVRTSIENFLKTNPDYGYSVKVSGFMVVPRTREISLFDSFRDHVGESTDVVVFTNYYGKGNTGEAICLFVNEESIPQENKSGSELNGMQVPLKTITERGELRKQIFTELQNDFLTQENDRLKKELTKAEKFIREVDLLLAQLRQQRPQVKDKGTLEVIGNFVSRLAIANPDLLKENPTIEALLSFLPSDQDKQPLPPPTNENAVSGTPEVTIKPKQQEQDPEVTRVVMILKELRRHFSEIEFEYCLRLLKSLSGEKELIPFTIKWVEGKIEEKRQWLARHNEVSQDQENTETTKTEPGKKEQPEIGYEQPNVDDEERPYHP